jgi:hypothetical protein
MSQSASSTSLPDRNKPAEWMRMSFKVKRFQIDIP